MDPVTASSHGACDLADLPQRRAAYACYLAADLVFAAVTLARLVRTARLSRAQRRAANDPARPLLDHTAPGTDPANVSLTPKILYFSLTFSTCVGLFLTSTTHNTSNTKTPQKHPFVFFSFFSSLPEQSAQCFMRCRARPGR